MSETIVIDRRAAPAGLVLIDFYQQLWNADRATELAKEAMGEASVEAEVKVYAEMHDLHINAVKELSSEQLAAVGRSALETFVDHQKADLARLRARSERDRIKEGLQGFLSTLVGKRIFVQELDKSSDAIKLVRLGFKEENRQMKHVASGTGRLVQSGPSLYGEDTLELRATEFTRSGGGGTYFVQPIDAQSGEPQVSFTVAA